MSGLADPTGGVLDPHVIVAIFCIAGAIVAALLVACAELGR